MIISRTPMRMSFVGGGSDLPSFYKRHRGAVISTSINKYIYISVHKYFIRNQIKLKYSSMEEVKNLNDIGHPIIKKVLQSFGVTSGLEITSSADVPGGTGLGSSSTFTVGLINVLSHFTKFKMSIEEIASLACKIEIEDLNEPIGRQDQYAAAYGGFNLIEFNEDDSVKIEKVNMSSSFMNKFKSNLHLFYLGGTRSAKKILNAQNNLLIKGENVSIQREMVKLVYKFKEAIKSENLDNLGNLLDENWQLKKQLTRNISNTEIDDIYSTALGSGALGGKLLGAGGSGFMLLYCRKENAETLKKNLSHLRFFDFDFDLDGTKIIHGA